MSYKPFYYDWDFVKYRKVYFIISLTLLILGIVAFILFGLNLSIDFTSGTRVEVLVGQDFENDEINSILSKIGIEASAIERSGEGENTRAVLSFIGTITKEQFDEMGKEFQAKYGDQVSLSETTVSPLVGQELAKKALYSVLLASLGIILYIAFRYEYRFAISAIIALLNNVLIVIGLFAILRLQVDLTFIAAILTIVGYAVNDTIVIFDRIRENLSKYKTKRFEDIANVVNISIRESLARSINTGITVIFAAIALVIFGGEGVRNFSLALLFGLVIGTLSSLCIASQIWLEWRGRDLERARMRKPQAES